MKRLSLVGEYVVLKEPPVLSVAEARKLGEGRVDDMARDLVRRLVSATPEHFELQPEDCLVSLKHIIQ
jgi:hypothetical protein